MLVDDIQETEKWKNLRRKKFFDIISKHDLFSFLEGREKDIQAFIHLGACSDTTVTNGDYVMENNYRYSVRLAEYALTHGHRFIYASSAATYGDGSLGFNDDHDVIDELKPLNLYGFSKQLFDMWLKERGVLNQVVGLKYFNIFGPNEDHKKRMASLVYHMTPKIITEGKISLFKSSEPNRFADGDQCRDFFYVKDAVAITCQFLDWPLSGIYNVGRGGAKTWNELASATFSALNLKKEIEYRPMPKDLIGKYQNYTCANMEKFDRHLQEKELIKPKVHTLDEAVRDYVCNYLIKDETW